MRAKLIQLRNLLNKLAPFTAPTLFRLIVGLVFIGTGWGKLHGQANLIDYFAALHIPAPEIMAPFVAWTEFLGGMFVLIGLGTRFAAAPLVGTMFVAIITAKLGDVHGLTDLVGLQEFDYGVFALALVVMGGGPLSLDRLIVWLAARKKSATKAGQNPTPVDPTNVRA